MRVFRYTDHFLKVCGISTWRNRKSYKSGHNTFLMSKSRRLLKVKEAGCSNDKRVIINMKIIECECCEKTSRNLVWCG